MGKLLDYVVIISYGNDRAYLSESIHGVQFHTKDGYRIGDIGLWSLKNPP